MSEFLRSYARQNGQGGGDAAAPGGGDSAATQQAGGNTQRAMASGATVFSALFTLGAAASEARALEQQAGDELLIAEAEQTQGQREVTNIRRTALQADAARRVAFAASGVDLQSLTVQQIGREDDRFVQDAIAETANRTSRNAARRRIYAQRLADRAAETFGGGVLSAASQFQQAGAQAMAAGGGG